MNDPQVHTPETRHITCPKCDPEHKTPDTVSGWNGSLKYILFQKRCKVCNAELVDLGTTRKTI